MTSPFQVQPRGSLDLFLLPGANETPSIFADFVEPRRPYVFKGFSPTKAQKQVSDIFPTTPHQLLTTIAAIATITTNHLNSLHPPQPLPPPQTSRRNGARKSLQGTCTVCCGLTAAALMRQVAPAPAPHHQHFYSY